MGSNPTRSTFITLGYYGIKSRLFSVVVGQNPPATLLINQIERSFDERYLYLGVLNSLVSFAIIFIATRNIPHAVSELAIEASYGSMFSC